MSPPREADNGTTHLEDGHSEGLCVLLPNCHIKNDKTGEMQEVNNALSKSVDRHD